MLATGSCNIHVCLARPMHEPGLSNKRLNTRGGGHKKSDRLRAQWAGRRACPSSLRSLVRACVDAPRIPRLVLRASGAGVHDLSARSRHSDNCMVPSPYLKKKKGNASENDAHASSILGFKFACPGGLSTMLEGNRQKRYGDRRGE